MHYCPDIRGGGWKQSEGKKTQGDRDFTIVQVNVYIPAISYKFLLKTTRIIPSKFEDMHSLQFNNSTPRYSVSLISKQILFSQFNISEMNCTKSNVI